MKERNTEEILGVLKRGDKQEFLRLIYAYKQDCMKYLLSKTNSDSEEVEDIFIEAVISLWEKSNKGGLDEILNIKSYLIGICYTMWKNTYFKTKKRIEAIPDVERYFYDYLDKNNIEGDRAQSLKEGLLDISQQALDSLGEKCREIIKYVYFEKKNMDQIADIMGFNSPDVVSSTKYRCFKQLREKALQLQQDLIRKEY